MLSESLIRFRKPIVWALHLTLIPVGYWAAFALRFDGRIPDRYEEVVVQTLLILVPVRLVAIAGFGLLHGWWRHVGMQDLLDLVKAITLSSVAFVLALFLTGNLSGLPRSVLVLDWVVAILLFGGIRFGVRAVRESHAAPRGVDRREKPALVIGAGEAAERLIRQLRHGGGGFRAVGLVDDDPAKRGMRLHGVPVLGSTADLRGLVARTRPKLLVIAIPSAGREEMKRIVARCMETHVEFKIVPSLVELLDGRARVGELRDVQIEDLLGREAIQLDLENVRRDLAGKVVMITGGAGSIGSELARQVAAIGPSRLVLVEQAESPLYFTQMEIRGAHPGLCVHAVMADVTDASRMRGVFAEERPHYVFHAAAYKHVPMMEENVAEAVKNNVLGTQVVAECAARCGAEKFVLISTDKAVYPSSVMGATKRVAERIVLGLPALRGKTDFRAVRFGNVLGSEGSVVPVFRRQLAAGGPITVTHPEVTRYFMTIPEAVQLVLQASALPEVAGHIAMLDMGCPVRIVELAENLISLSGLEPYKDVPIVFTGLRPGEKLHEDLMSMVEETVGTAVEKIRIVQTDESDGARVTWGLRRLAAALEAGDLHETLDCLLSLVPECVSPLADRLAASVRLEEAGGMRPRIVVTHPAR